MSKRRIDLVFLAETPPDWPLGKVHCVPTSNQRDEGELAGLVAAVESLGAATEGGIGNAGNDDHDEHFVLFWDPAIAGQPDPETLAAVARLPGELWHAGLLLGQGGRPRLLDFVHPTWMPNLDPPADHIASSWRLSLRACLMPARLLRDLGGPSALFDSLEIASLDLGFRYLRAGVLCRHVPGMIGRDASVSSRGEPDFSRREPGLADELRFARRHLGRRWTSWAMGRAVLTGLVSLAELWRARKRIEGDPPETPLATELRSTPTPYRESSDGIRVTVLLPTLDRYPYLEVILRQLAEQTVPPSEVIVVDQTDKKRRHRDWMEAAPDLPLVALEQERAGQCSSRNRGLLAATGDAILFLDDDDEIEPDLIEKHLASLRATGAEVSCGVADEAGAGLPPGPRHRRLADVFPTNNAMVLRSALERSGLFDLAYEKGARADMDLGIRLYRSGALMVLDPEISVFHHRAPSGGLRRHRARKMTYAASRRSLFARHLPSPTEIYLHYRYFSSIRCREADLLRLAGTFAIRGGPIRRLAKLLISTALLPDTWLRIRDSQLQAELLASRFPEIAQLGDDPGPDLP